MEDEAGPQGELQSVKKLTCGEDSPALIVGSWGQQQPTALRRSLQLEVTQKCHPGPAARLRATRPPACGTPPGHTCACPRISGQREVVVECRMSALPRLACGHQHSGHRAPMREHPPCCHHGKIMERRRGRQFLQRNRNELSKNIGSPQNAGLLTNGILAGAPRIRSTVPRLRG